MADSSPVKPIWYQGAPPASDFTAIASDGEGEEKGKESDSHMPEMQSDPESSGSDTEEAADTGLTPRPAPPRKVDYPSYNAGEYDTDEWKVERRTGGRARLTSSASMGAVYKVPGLGHTPTHTPCRRCRTAS
jgi:hypothetical protein